MKKRVMLAGLILLTLAGWAVMPGMVKSSIPTVYYITPALKTYENTINCSGVLQSEDVRQIYLQSAVVADEVFVTVGDVVQSGDLLVRLDPEKTENLSRLPAGLIRNVSDELGGVDFTALVSAYGLSGIAGGIDPALLEELTGQAGLLEGGSGVVPDLTSWEILAPISGVVTEVDIQKEVPAQAGKVIFTIADNQRYKAVVSVKEEDIGRVGINDDAKVWGVGFSGAFYTGRVTKISPTARKALSGAGSETVVDVEITLDQSDESLKPGFTARAEIMGGQNSSLVTVPYEAVRQDENNREYVYLYEDGKLKKQIVTTGREMIDEVEVVSGVSVDSVVVYNPSDAVSEGAMIHIRGRANVSEDD